MHFFEIINLSLFFCSFYRYKLQADVYEERRQKHNQSKIFFWIVYKNTQRLEIYIDIHCCTEKLEKLERAESCSSNAIVQFYVEEVFVYKCVQSWMISELFCYGMFFFFPPWAERKRDFFFKKKKNTQLKRSFCGNHGLIVRQVINRRCQGLPNLQPALPAMQERGGEHQSELTHTNP